MSVDTRDEVRSELVLRLVTVRDDAAGLAPSCWWGSSREGEERTEAELDALLREHGTGPTTFDHRERQESS
jgi:hypothetical protein